MDLPRTGEKFLKEVFDEAMEKIEKKFTDIEEEMKLIHMRIEALGKK